MKKVLITAALFLSSHLSDQARYRFIGFLSFFNSYLQITLSWIQLYVCLGKYSEIVKRIDTEGKKIIVFGPSTDWHDIKQRPQHLAKAFAQRGDCLVIFLTKNQTKDHVSGIEKVTENCYLVENFFIVDRFFKDYIFIFIGPSSFMFEPLFKKRSKLVYDFPDELSFFPGLSRSIVMGYHNKLLNIADLVTPSATFLENIVLSNNPSANTAIILNGVFPEDFAINSDTCFIPADLIPSTDKGCSIVGFYGGLGEGWVDFELIKYCVDKRPDLEFIIIGGGNISAIKKKYSFGDFSNISFLGPKKYDELKYYAKYFSVALIPFKMNDLTLGVSPVKSFEYMVQGIPFVSTGLPECRKYKNVLIAENPEQFLAMIDKGILLKDDIDYVSGLKLEGSDNTWNSRTDEVLRQLSLL